MEITPRTLSGFKDRLPQDAILKTKLIEKLVYTFNSFGFSPIETPHLEYADILIKQGSEEKELYRFLDHGNRDVALRFDLTVPLARFVAQHFNSLTIPFKRYAIGNVFRGERAQAGRYREFTQCDFDILGSKSIGSDYETISLIAQALKNIDIENFQIKINNRKIMNGLFEYIDCKDKIENILRIVDKIDKVGLENIKQELENLGLIQSQISEVLDFILLDNRQSSKYKNYNSLTCEGIEELEELEEILIHTNLDKNCKFDFSIARGLGYYTGIVYETKLLDNPTLGSVASGGRYDNLVGRFSNQNICGVGASIGLDRLMVALGLQAIQTEAILLILQLDKKYTKEIYKIANIFRSKNVKTEVYPDVEKLKKQLTYANKKGHRFALFYGDDEANTETFGIRNLHTGEQQKLASIDEIIKMLF